MLFKDNIQNYSFKYFMQIMIFGFILAFFVACTSREYVLPSELSLTAPKYTKKVSHIVGPGGINHMFQVFKLRPEIVQQINQDGLSFLNAMPSAINHPFEAKRKTYKSGPYRASFPKWSKLPIAKVERWKRRSYSVDLGDQPTAAEFFGDVTTNNDFTNTIDAKTLELFHSTIRSGKGYYAWGGYRDICVLIVSPENGLAYYLFRD